MTTPSGVVLPQTPPPADGVLDESTWTGLDVVSQGAVTEALPQPPRSPTEYEWQVEHGEAPPPPEPTQPSTPELPPVEP